MAVSLEELASLIFTTFRGLRERSPKTAVDPFTQAEIEALRFVGEGRSPTMKEFARFFMVKPPTATFIVGTLVSAGHLSRTRDRNDRRVVRLDITPQGKRMLERANKRKLEHIKESFSPLDAKEREELARILRKLSNAHKK